MIHTAALIIFRKNLTPGHVKTRIATEAGEAKALEIYAALLEKTKATALSLNIKRFAYYVGTIGQDDWNSADFTKRIQQGSDLGERMELALQEVLQEHSAAILIGSDCPALSPAILEEARSRLMSPETDVVLGPAEDGGYYLIGLKQVLPGIFRDMPWSTPTVFQETCLRLERTGKRYSLLPSLRDVDTWTDWQEYLSA